MTSLQLIFLAIINFKRFRLKKKHGGKKEKRNEFGNCEIKKNFNFTKNPIMITKIERKNKSYKDNRLHIARKSKQIGF